MECVVVLSALVLHCALRVLPDPVSATALQPDIDTPPSVKLMVPVGLKPVTEAVKVTLAPALDGLAELDTVVVLAALFTVCVSVLLVEVLLLASPAYTALMLWVPAASTAALQPLIGLAPSLKLTLPVGALPLTVAVKVTLLPAVEGVSEVAMPVVLATLLTVWESAALLEPAF